MKYKIGDLIRWYVLYDDISIVRSTGVGAVIGCQIYELGSFQSAIYKVFRCLEGDEISVDESCLELLSEKDCNNRLSNE